MRHLRPRAAVSRPCMKSVVVVVPTAVLRSGVEDARVDRGAVFVLRWETLKKTSTATTADTSLYTRSGSIYSFARLSYRQTNVRITAAASLGTLTEVPGHPAPFADHCRVTTEAGVADARERVGQGSKFPMSLFTFHPWLTNASGI